MKEHLLKDLEDKATVAIDDIDFVLTEPAIWDDTAKMFMREAAVKAGIKTAQLRIALESEAASICCRFTDLDLTEIDKTFFMAEKEKGVKYLLVDLGDGTADVTVHQFNKDGMLEEIVPASGDSWGGSCIDRDFHDFLQELFGEKVMDIFDTDSDYIEDYHDFWQHFETKKKTFDIKRTEKQEEKRKKVKVDTHFFISIPVAIKEIIEKLEKKTNPQNFKKKHMEQFLKDVIAKSPYQKDLTCIGGKILVNSSLFKRKIFDPTTKVIVKHLAKIHQNIENDLKVILMVGQFSECSFVQEAVKAEFQGKCKVVIPNQAGLSVVKGAVFFGHQPHLISERVSRYTYGIQTWPPFDEKKHKKAKKVNMKDRPRCKDVFFKIVTKGERIKPGYKQSCIFKALRPSDKKLECGVYISSEENPMYVDDRSCSKLGTLEVQLERSGRNSDIEESLMFGDTELHFFACDSKNKREYTVTFDLLSEEMSFPEK